MSNRGITTVISIFVTAVFLLSGISGCQPENSEVASDQLSANGCDSTFTNPVMDGADPWVFKKGGNYYFCETRDGGIYVSKSQKLTDPKDWKQVWQQPDEGWNQTNLWAPELHYLQGEWYIFYTAGREGPPFTSQRSGVLQSTSQDPQEPFEEKAQLYTGNNIQTKENNIWSIDLTPLSVDGQLYGIWSGWEENRSDDATTQHLFIAEMENPWTISSNRVKISSPEESWERGNEVEFGINEGAEVLRHDDKVFVIYSTRESWLPYYRLGQLQLSGPDADPMNPENWRKSGPVFQGHEQVHGVGHASFTTSPDGTENWIIYHSKKSTEPGWNRDIRMQPFGWDQDGNPDFGRPVHAGESLPVPSGQCSE